MTFNHHYLIRICILIHKNIHFILFSTRVQVARWAFSFGKLHAPTKVMCGSHRRYRSSVSSHPTFKRSYELVLLRMYSSGYYLGE